MESHEPGPITAHRGGLFPDTTLHTADGGRVELSAYRGQAHLVLMLAGSGADERAAALARALGERAEALRALDARALEIVAVPPAAAQAVAARQTVPFPVLGDPDGRLHRSVGAITADGEPAPAVYVTDRYGEVFATYVTGQGQELPGPDEVLGWLEYIDHQCPECTGSEWPPE